MVWISGGEFSALPFVARAQTTTHESTRTRKKSDSTISTEVEGEVGNHDLNHSLKFLVRTWYRNTYRVISHDYARVFGVT